MINEKRVIELLNRIPWDNSFVKTYVGMCYERTDAPLAYGLAGALSLLSANAHPELGAFLGGRIHANTWLMLVGPSGWSRKSTSVNISADIQNLVDPSLVGREPGSIEGLMKSLSVAEQQTLYLEELGDFLSQTSGNGRLGPLRENLTRLYDGTRYAKVYSQQEFVIERPRVSLLAGVTEQYLESYTLATDWEGGFMGRWAIFAATPERFLTSTARRQDLIDHCAARMAWVRSIQATLCEGLEDNAMEYWNRWSRAIHKDSLAHPEHWVSAAGARMQTFAAKIAMLLCLDAGIDVTRPWRVPLAVLKIAIDIAHMAYDSMCYVVGELCSTKFARERRNVLRALQRAMVRDDAQVVGMKDLLNYSSPRLELRDARRIVETLLVEETIYKRMGGAEAYSLYPPSEEELANLNVMV